MDPLFFSDVNVERMLTNDIGMFLQYIYAWFT